MSVNREMLNTVHEMLCKTLIDRFNNKEITAAEMSVALKLLQHNGIEAEYEHNKPLQDVVDTLPFTVLDGTVEEEQDRLVG